jgi:hypothetical protein
VYRAGISPPSVKAGEVRVKVMGKAPFAMALASANIASTRA